MSQSSPWLPLQAGTGFGLHNLPFGVFSTEQDDQARVGVAFGDHVIDVSRLDVPGASELARDSLNDFMTLGVAMWEQFRACLQELLTEVDHRPVVEPHLVPLGKARLHLPIDVADYVDFYSSQHHAENIGRMFRPDSEPLTPNWKHLPIGYHGRSGTVAVSGTPVVRPHGQRLAPGDTEPSFGPTTRLDIEAEVAFVVGVPAPLGGPVPISAFAEHVFGVCLLNDWSARDIQSWEYVPLGPFLGKSFLTSISPWVVPIAALNAARVRPPARDPQPLPYLRDDDDPWGLDVALEVRLNGELISSPPFAQVYWTAAQQLAHMTVNGASLRTGDLFASGTVSGPNTNQCGSLIELTWGGTEPLVLADGTSRSFLEDGDEVVITATAPALDGSRLSFGEVHGRVQPASSAATSR